MRLGRTILALLMALSLALLPLAGAAAAAPNSAEMTAGEVAHDCCHPGSPCDDHGKTGNNNASIGTCAKCCSYTGVVSCVDLSAPLKAAAPTMCASTHVVSQIGNPPFRPPRV
jgi:hypothetical protein